MGFSANSTSKGLLRTKERFCEVGELGFICFDSFEMELTYTFCHVDLLGDLYTVCLKIKGRFPDDEVV